MWGLTKLFKLAYEMQVGSPFTLERGDMYYPFQASILWAQPEWAEATVLAGTKPGATDVEKGLAWGVNAMWAAVPSLLVALCVQYKYLLDSTRVAYPAARAIAAAPAPVPVPVTRPQRASSVANEASAASWAQRVFAAADENGDGKLTHKEIKNYFKAHPDDKQTLLGKDFHWSDFFSAMDKDGDGLFDAGEFSSMTIKLLKRVLRRAEGVREGGAGGSTCCDAAAASAAKTAEKKARYDVAAAHAIAEKQVKAAELKSQQAVEQAEGALEDVREVLRREREDRQTEQEERSKENEQTAEEIRSIMNEHEAKESAMKARIVAEQEEKARKEIEEWKETAGETNDDLKKARSQLLKQRQKHRQELKELTNSEAYLASKYLTDRLRELHDAATRRGRRGGAGGRLPTSRGGGGFPSLLSTTASSLSPPQQSPEQGDDAAGGAGDNRALVPYALRISSLKDDRIAGVYVHSNAHNPTGRFHSGRPYFERYGGEDDACFLFYDLALERWVFGSADPLGPSKAAELYAVSAGRVPAMFPEHVARWLVPAVALNECCSKDAIEKEDGWEPDNHIKAAVLDQNSDGDLEISSTEQQEYVFDGLYTPRRSVNGKMCYKKQSAAGSGVPPCYLFFDTDLELWVIGEGSDHRTSQILAVSLDVDYADFNNHSARELGLRWAIATGSNCTLDREFILGLVDGWQPADVQVVDRSAKLH